SVARRIAEHYPCANIVNRAREGAMTKVVAAQIAGTGDTHFDLALVQTGAIDVLRFTAPGDLRRAIIMALNHARARADHVVFLMPGNVGLAPIFVPPFNWISTRTQGSTHFHKRGAGGRCRVRGLVQRTSE
ncbi:MAG TPA: hypothetical protein VHJ19_08095, partial [Gammaproteobacteria bacterium]|nr:hypothetical protein [Gammaproteobacteria bacterium]